MAWPQLGKNVYFSRVQMKTDSGLCCSFLFSMSGKNEENAAERNPTWFCDCLAGDKCHLRQCSKVQAKGGHSEKDGRLWGSLISLLGVTDSRCTCTWASLEDAERR